MSKRRLISILALVGIVAAAAILWALQRWAPEEESSTVVASGTIDATQVAIAFRMAGILRSRPVDEGSTVGVGDLLAELDSREATARLRQAQAAEAVALARLKDLEQGYRPPEIAEAKAQVELARANARHLQDEAARSEQLFATGAVSRQRRDRDSTAAAVALEQQRAVGERLKLLQAGFRTETVSAARAQVLEAQAAVEAARVALDDLRVTSTIDGTVTRKHAEPGETVAAGRPVVTITDVSNPWVRVYIPESRIGAVRLGAPADVRIDTFPDRRFEGRVTYVAAQAEFTPKNVQTQEERVKLVFAVNVAVEHADGVLKPGMPADVHIRTDVVSR